VVAESVLVKQQRLILNRSRHRSHNLRVCDHGVHGGIVDGVALCRMFNRAIRGQSLPKYLSSDHDPLYRFHQWQARIRETSVIFSSSPG
jgi:hypothetical protein